jgi:cation-transporting ATPase E
VAGAGRIRATAVGDEAYARRIAAEARQFRRAPSDLMAGTNRVLAIISWLLAPVAAVVVWGQLGAGGSSREVAIATVGSLVGMIPQGLVLLTSVAFAVSVVRLARRNAVVDQLPSVEGLARVDVLCADKTGTLTESALQVSRVETLDESLAADAIGALGALARISPAQSRNSTAAAIAEAFPASAESPSATVAFSSRRKYSAVTLGGGTWALGAPDALLAEGAHERERMNAWAAEGTRVLLVARAAKLLDIRSDADSQPAALEPALAVLFEERIRPDAADTLRYFREQGVELRIISGDNPATVAAVARRVGLDMLGEPFDAQRLPEAPGEIAQVMESHNIFGRVRPEQKRAMVKALQSRGHTVAMTGDGVNDVLALKDADVGIAMGSGTAATRAVARLTLLDSRFAALPEVVREGRRVIANIERVANLFVTKTVYALWLSLAIAIMRVEFPLLPRHLTLIGVATIGLPGAALALGLLAPRYRPGFLPRVARFTLIAGTAAAAATFSVYVVSLGRGLSAAGAKSPAALTLALAGLWVLAIVARPWNAWRVALVVSMAGLIVLAFSAPEVARFLALPPMSTASVATATGAAIVAAVVIEAGLRISGPSRHGTAQGILHFDVIA